MTWAARTESSDGKTSPEELIAAAHAACFSMALSHALAEAGNAPERLETSATVTFVPGHRDHEVGPHRDRPRARARRGRHSSEAAEGAKDGCPVSGALKGNVELSVDASLDS